MSRHIETIAIHSGMNRPAGDNRSVVPPVETSTIFEHRKEGASEGDMIYSRYENPNRSQLEQVLRDLEGGEAAAAFSSGVAAITSVLQALHPGSHVLFPEDLYHGSRVLIQEFGKRWGLSYDFVDMRSMDKVKEAIKTETRLLWLESPSNPMLHISSVKELAAVAHNHDAMVAIDNTWPTPYNMQPLMLGADLVIHSTTKYLGGHSDILGGAVIAAKEQGIFNRIRDIQHKQGAVPSPRDCWLLYRSIRSFPYRMKGHNEHAMMLAAFLDKHPAVERVFYPGLESHPGHETAKNEMKGFGGMISFLVKGSAEDTLKIVASSTIITRATSLGGVESTWEHRHSSEGEDSPTPDNLIRLSVGLEHPDDLIEDLQQALEA